MWKAKMDITTSAEVPFASVLVKRVSFRDWFRKIMKTQNSHDHRADGEKSDL
jgi:hypothetical protein